MVNNDFEVANHVADRFIKNMNAAPRRNFCVIMSNRKAAKNSPFLFHWCRKNMVGVVFKRQQIFESRAWIVARLLEGHVVFHAWNKTGGGWGGTSLEGERERINRWGWDD